jgi:hypothetical protein
VDGAAFMAGQVGIEPTTSCFGDRHSAKLSYWPVCCKASFVTRLTDVNRLLGFAMHCMFLTTLAILAHFHAPRIIAAVLLGGVITLFTLTAGKSNHRSYVFLF